MTPSRPRPQHRPAPMLSCIAPEACPGVVHVATMGRETMQTHLPAPVRQGRHGLVRPMDAAAVDSHDHRLPGPCPPRGPRRTCNLIHRMGKMARSAEDIRITGIDINQYYPSPENPRLQRIYLTLSGLPPAAWQTIFTRERGVARQTLWRAARIEGSCILIIMHILSHGMVVT